MKLRALVLTALSVSMMSPLLMAQTCPTTTTTNTTPPPLVCTLPQLFGPSGLTLPNPKHKAHFQDVSIHDFQPLNTAIGEELSTLPLGSSGSGTTFTLDKDGHPVPVLDSLGPILTERANVIGRKVFQVGVAYQYFSFGEIDGLNLHGLPVALQHDVIAHTSYENDYITTVNQLHLSLNQTVIYGVIGISNRMDASIEVPIDAVHFTVTSAAQIVRTQPCENTMDPVTGGGGCTGPVLDPSNAAVCGEFHYFASTSDCPTIFKSVTANYGYGFTNQKTDAAGIGDVILRTKYEVIRGEKFTGSVGIGFRFPSGDAKNFIGSGAYGVAPFGAITYRARFSPHARIGYQWNSHSLLAGNDPTTAAGSDASLPPEFLYEAGADYRAMKRVTLVADWIGGRVLSGSRISAFTFNDFNGKTVSSIKAGTGSYNTDAIGVGAKVRVWRQLLAIGNVSFRVNSGGLHATAVPLAGLSYAF